MKMGEAIRHQLCNSAGPLRTSPGSQPGQFYIWWDAFEVDLGKREVRFLQGSVLVGTLPLGTVHLGDSSCLRVEGCDGRTMLTIT